MQSLQGRISAHLASRTATRGCALGRRNVGLHLLHTSRSTAAAATADDDSEESRRSSGSRAEAPTRVAVLGAGLAGLATAFHLVQLSTPGRPVHVDVIDSEGIGGGASGVAAGLLHPFTPKGRLLWLGREAMQEALALLDAAQAAAPGATLARRNGILRPAQPASAASSSSGGDDDDASSPDASSPPLAEGAVLLDPQQAASLLPGLAPAAPGPSLFYPEGVALVVRGYLDSLWAATRLAAASRPGCSVQLLRERVTSLSSVAAGGSGGRRYAAVVVAAGASAAVLPELAALPVKTCGGAVVHLRPGAASQWLPETAPGVLGAPYLVPTETGMSIGATREWDVPPDDGFLSGASEVAAPRRLRAEQELLPKAHERLPLLRDWGVSAVEWGVRAQPPRTRHGRLPLIGRLPDATLTAAPVGGGAPDAPPPAAAVWVFVGLGARGIVYHALLGKALAVAVLDGDAAGLPEDTRAVWENALAAMTGGTAAGSGDGDAERSGGGGVKKKVKRKAAAAQQDGESSSNNRRGGGEEAAAAAAAAPPAA